MPSMVRKSGSTKSVSKGFFSWLMNFFVGNSPEQQAKRALKKLGDTISRMRYKFYRPKGGQALPDLGKFFLKIYQTTVSTQAMLSNAKNSEGFKRICIDTFLNKEQVALLASLEEGTIRESAKTQDPAIYVAKLQGDLKTFMGSLERPTLRLIDETYSHILNFVDFISFDYYSLLRKFDATFRSGTIITAPRLGVINGSYITTDLKDFLYVFLAMDLTANWDKIFTILSIYKSVDVINRQTWSSLLNTFKGVIASNIFTMIIRHLDKDPYWKPSITTNKVRIAEDYLNRFRSKTEKVIQTIRGEKRHAEGEKLCVAVFGSGSVRSRMEYYTEEENAMFSNIPSMRYTYVLPMSYLRTYFVEHFKKRVQEMTNLIMVRGQWVTSEQSKQIADPYYRVNDVYDRLVKFDASLSDDQGRGNLLRRALGRVVFNDSSSTETVQAIVEEINNDALAIINDAARKFIVFGNNLRALTDDYGSTPSNLVINWQELATLSSVPLKDTMAKEYRRIYYFIQLLRIFVK